MRFQFYKISFLLLFLYSAKFMAAQQPKILMVVPPDKFHDSEFSDPMLALDSANIDVTISSLKMGKIGGVDGDTIYSTLLLKDAEVADFDAICIMGGKGTGQYLWENEETNQLLQDFKAQDKLVTGICAGSVSLARAGVLKNKKATTYPVKGFIRQLEENGAIYSSDSVVVDGNIVTANGPAGARSFGRVLVENVSK